MARVNQRSTMIFSDKSLEAVPTAKPIVRLAERQGNRSEAATSWRMASALALFDGARSLSDRFKEQERRVLNDLQRR